MSAVAARRFDGAGRPPRAVRIEAVDGALLLHDTRAEALELDQIGLSDRTTGAPRLLHLPDGSVCEVDDVSAFDAVLARARRADRKARRMRPTISAALIVLALLLCAIGWRWGVPVLADAVAERIPASWIRSASDRTLTILDAKTLRPSQLSPERQTTLTTLFAGLRASSTGAPPYRVLFRHGGDVGATVMSLPSGEVIVTDELVNLLGDDRQILAMLSHELGHLYYQHALKRAVRHTPIASTAANYFSDFDAGAAALARGLLQADCPLAFELAADGFALDMLAANGIDPTSLRGALQKLSRQPPKPGYLPPIERPEQYFDERIAALSGQ